MSELRTIEQHLSYTVTGAPQGDLRHEFSLQLEDWAEPEVITLYSQSAYLYIDDKAMRDIKLLTDKLSWDTGLSVEALNQAYYNAIVTRP